MSIEAGRTIGPYQIIKPLGAGGTGEVHLARDSRLDREVALKILRSGATGDSSDAGALREAKAASRLNHPNVAHVYELWHDGEWLCIAMEYLDAGSLSSKLAGGPLPIDVAVQIAIEVADALDAAHAKGIVHRDVKPGNVMLTSRGHAKLVDFGLAKITSGAADESTVTVSSPGVIRGTVSYMSPEQAVGGSVDQRSDIFSFGVLLYEMTAGRRAFDGSNTTETLGRILNTQPEAISRFNYNAPPELDRIVRKCLAKAADERYQSARELLIDLRSMQRDLQAGRTRASAATPLGAAKPLKRRELRWLAIAMIALAVAAATLVWWYRNKPATTSVAVLPFVNETGTEELEYAAEGVTESVINSLCGLQNLRVLSRAAVYRFKGRENDAQAVGRQLSAKAVLLGRVSLRQNKMVIRTDLIDVKSNRQLWGQQFTATLAEIPSVQDQIAQETARRLQVTLSEDQRRLLTRRFTRNPQAYELYVKGRFHWNKRSRADFDKAIQYFEGAIRADPKYALAHAGLADVYAQMSGFLPPREIMPRAKAAALRALEIDESLAEAHASLAFVKFHYDWDWLETERECKRALQLNPNYPTAHSIYARFLNAAGRFDEAVEQIRLAQELDPLALGVGTGYGLSYYFDRKFDAAIDQYRKVLELDQRFALARANLAAALVQKGDITAAIPEFEKSLEQMTSDVSIQCELAQARALLGRKQDAAAILDKIIATSRARYINAPPVAWVYAGLGDNDTAFQWLERGYSERAWPMVFLKVEPKYDSLRADRRFTDLLRRMGL